ncbi:MAG: hypothetical protein PHH08_00560 [Candidatus ainarchaeum sp.]|nr:hypothetical protein [Candidatus ainarchaeum sp.]
MTKKVLLLDSSAVLNDFNFAFKEGCSYATTSQIVWEIRDLRSRSLVESALQKQLISVVDPKPETVNWVIKKTSQSGFQRLSSADLSIIALAVEFKELPQAYTLMTDDYSIQNFCMLFEIPFEPIIQGRIKKPISFRTVCSNCSKEFSNETGLKRCDICDSPLKKTRNSP